MATFNGRSTVLDKQPLFGVFTDTCDDAGGGGGGGGEGGSFGFNWFYFNWNQVSSLHINEKEILAVVLAAQRWAKVWENKYIILVPQLSVTALSRRVMWNALDLGAFFRES